MDPQPDDEISAEPRATSGRIAWVIAVVLLAAALARTITLGIDYQNALTALRHHDHAARAPVAPASAGVPKLASSTTALPESGALTGDVTVVTARFSPDLAEVIVTARISGGRPHSRYTLAGGNCAGTGPDHTWAAGLTNARGSANLAGRARTVTVSDEYYLVLGSLGTYQTHPAPAVHGYFGLARGLSAVRGGIAPCDQADG